jgi:SAM-dependent methyltransferase
MPVLQKILKKALNTASGNRKAHYKNVAKIAQHAKGKTVLEIGSGKAVDGKYSYSTEHLFVGCKEFIKTDINPNFGHMVLDITKMKQKNSYDIILCLNVLEHVYDFQLAVNNMEKALKKDGILVIAVPFTFPLHDEPIDFWRFTEHSLRKILSNFQNVDITPYRSRRWPTAYFVTAVKK